jgi:hypothetical protein
LFKTGVLSTVKGHSMPDRSEITPISSIYAWPCHGQGFCFTELGNQRGKPPYQAIKMHRHPGILFGERNDVPGLVFGYRPNRRTAARNSPVETLLSIVSAPVEVGEGFPIFVAKPPFFLFKIARLWVAGYRVASNVLCHAN